MAGTVGAEADIATPPPVICRIDLSGTVVIKGARAAHGGLAVCGRRASSARTVMTYWLRRLHDEAIAALPADWVPVPTWNQEHS